MMNLFDIACKLTKSKKQTRIEFDKTKINDKSIFFIRYRKAGFNMKYVKNLFGIFQRIFKPSGLPVTCIGLTAVQQIVHSYSVHIWTETALDMCEVLYSSLPQSAHKEVFTMKDSS